MSVSRVRYRERQFLHQLDLSDEQSYRLAMRRRHNIAHHGWGIVTGLQIGGEDGILRIEAGLAVDGYGRELILPHEVEVGSAVLDSTELNGPGSPRLIDIWLIYTRVPESPKRQGRDSCGPGRHSRWREEARIRLEVTSGEPVDPRRPETVANADRDFGPQETPPDDPAREWPVYLGRIRRTAVGVDVIPVSRPYITLFGANVNTPSGRARMQIENELYGARRVFAVSTADDEGEWADRLIVDRSGKTAVYGDAALHGDLLLDEGGLEFNKLEKVPEEAKPWQIYQTAVSPKENKTINEMRFEIAHPGDEGDPSRYKLAVGHSAELNTFSPCLIVRADCAFIVNGDLDIDGELKESEIPADPNDPRFASVLLDSWLGGITSAAGTVDAHYSNPLEISFTQIDATPAAGGIMSYTVSIRNTGQTELRDLTVMEIVTLGAQAPQLTIIPLPPDSDTMTAGQTIPVPHNRAVPIAPGDEMTLLVTAIAAGPDGSQVQGTDTRVITIVDP